jgi:hypothetical protein
VYWEGRLPAVGDEKCFSMSCDALAPKCGCSGEGAIGREINIKKPHISKTTIPEKFVVLGPSAEKIKRLSRNRRKLKF